jgi:uncharacterized protein YecT (DUF1311 family)
MNSRPLSTTLAIVAMIAVGCSDGAKEQSPGEVLARDSALASDLKQSDTSAFADAAEVATAFNPDSALPPVNAKSLVRSSVAAASPAASSAPVPKRVDQSVPSMSRPAPSASPSTGTPVPVAPMRPAPATIHADPLPTRRLPAAPASSVSTTSRVDPRAAEFLAKVPGAALPPGVREEPCGSPTMADQRRCLMLRLARADDALDRTYQALIAVLKREAGTPPGGEEPATVKQLRAEQRAWLVYRDTECRRRRPGNREGPLWAPVRAQCLGEFSGDREAELARTLRERQGR